VRPICAPASPLSLGQAGAIRTDHHKSPRASNFPNLQVGSHLANFCFGRPTFDSLNDKMAPRSYSKTAKVPRRPFEAARLCV
jgi:hypothetical protein